MFGSIRFHVPPPSPVRQNLAVELRLFTPTTGSCPAAKPISSGPACTWLNCHPAGMDGLIPSRTPWSFGSVGGGTVRERSVQLVPPSMLSRSLGPSPTVICTSPSPACLEVLRSSLYVIGFLRLLLRPAMNRQAATIAGR
jgi:hypothetical protein